MKNEFTSPDFTSGCIEIRIDKGEVCVYFNKSGLDRLISLMGEMNGIKNKHLHLQDYEVLTEKSEKIVLGFFPGGQ